jgi:hypothetical protein
MKTSFLLGILGISSLAGLAWLTQQPESARATMPPAVMMKQSVTTASAPDPASPYSDAGFHAAETGLSPPARAGREIWFKATTGNARFHTYTFQQRVTTLSTPDKSALLENLKTL